MDEPRESDLLEAQLDLVDLSAIDEPSSSRLMHHSSLSKGFCVKEYEEQMESLKKENFNLKLRVYFLEQNSSPLPEGIENFQKQFTDLKVENESLSNDLNEKQQLLQQASIALEMLEEEKLSSQSCAQLMIAELKDKVKQLEQENYKLHDALNDINKSNIGNDTGYADFLGAVDMRDIELQRKVLEMSKLSEEYKQQVTNMQKEISKLNSMLKESESVTAALKYERDEMQERYQNAQSDSKLLSNELEIELKDFKEKWASTQCELNDVEGKLKESEDERQKTLKYLTQCLQTLDENRQKISYLETIIEQNQRSTINNATETKKDAEINELKIQLEKMRQQLEEVTTVELKGKSQEIEKLSQIINNMKNNGNISLSETPRFSLDYLYESFNDLKFQQAMEIKKQSQLKINDLIQELICLANSKNKEKFNQLKEQMAIVVEKQEVAEDAFSRCAELCSYTLNHLTELAQFLSTLLQNKEIRESLSNQSLINIQNILDKSVDFSRYSIDGRVSALPDFSMLESLITSARDSIPYIRDRNNEVVKVDKSAQSSVNCEHCDNFKDQLNNAIDDFEELKKINQLLEDEICEYREKLEIRDEMIQKCKNEIKVLTENEMENNVVLKDCQNSVRMMQTDKINLTSKLAMSEELVQKLEQRLTEFERDLEMNYVQKSEYEKYVKKANEEAVYSEAQTAAVRFELEEFRKLCPTLKFPNSSKTDNQKPDSDFKTTKDKENNDNLTTNMKTENVEALKQSLMHTENYSNVSCKNCPKYKAQVSELKKYLQACCEKLKRQTDYKNSIDRHVEKQLNKTEHVLQQVRSNMENIFKDKENLN